MTSIRNIGIGLLLIVGVCAITGLRLPSVSPSVGYLRSRVTGESRPDRFTEEWKELRKKGHSQIDENIEKSNSIESWRDHLYWVQLGALAICALAWLILGTNQKKAAEEIQQPGKRGTWRFWFLVAISAFQLLATSGYMTMDRKLVADQKEYAAEISRWRDAINKSSDDLESADTSEKKEDVLSELRQELKLRGAGSLTE